MEYAHMTQERLTITGQLMDGHSTWGLINAADIRYSGTKNPSGGTYVCYYSSGARIMHISEFK